MCYVMPYINLSLENRLCVHAIQIPYCIAGIDGFLCERKQQMTWVLRAFTKLQF